MNELRKSWREIALDPGGLHVVEELVARQPGQRHLLHLLQRERAGDEGEVERHADERRADDQDGVADGVEDGERSIIALRRRS